MKDERKKLFHFWTSVIISAHKTRRKVLKVAKMKDANYGCKDEGNDDGVSGQSVISQSVVSQSVVSQLSVSQSVVSQSVSCQSVSFDVCNVVYDV